MNSVQSRIYKHQQLVLSFSLVLSAFVLAGSAAAQDDNKPPQGFTAIFNGTDFKDWTGGLTKDPREIAAMSSQERADWDKKMNDGIKEHWRVSDGELVSDGQDPFLATTRDYGDFEMWVDWKIGPNGDSGIYLRGVPQVQIWDPSNEKVKSLGADKGSGGLWNNKTHERFPPVVADKPIGEWNRMYIRMVGPYVTVVLNDKKVADNVILENYYDPKIPVFARGPIYLQTHGSETRFRNVFVREFPAEEANKALSEIKGGETSFVPLFDGKDLSNWIGPVDEYEVVDNSLVCKAGHHGNLLTKDGDYDNFEVRLEFKLPPGGNNGLGIRTPDKFGDAAYEGNELQILDDTAPQYKDLHEYQFCGSLYGLAPAHRGFLRPVGEWNFEESRIDGDRVIVNLNGFEVLNVDIAEVREKPLDGKEHPGARRTSGHIALCGHHDPVAFRDIRVKRLTPK